MIEAYTSPTGNCRRVTVMLEACGVPYRLHRIDRDKGEHKAPAFLAINPAAMVPVIIDGDGPGGRPLTVTQSGAILIYLAEKSGRFLPKAEPERSRTLVALMQVLTDVNPTNSIYFNLHNKIDAGPAARDFIASRLQRYLGHCDAMLAGSEHLAGELSIADFALLPVAARRREIIAGWKLANLLRWLDALLARPELKRGLEIA